MTPQLAFSHPTNYTRIASKLVYHASTFCITQLLATVARDHIGESADDADNVDGGAEEDED